MLTRSLSKHEGALKSRSPDGAGMGVCNGVDTYRYVIGVLGLVIDIL